MSRGSGQTRVGELGFQVIGRALHPEWFRSLAFRRVHQTGWQADVRIIPGGHVVHWSSGRVRLTEVLCGGETALPEDGVIYRSAVRNERSVNLLPADNLSYQACFAVERLDAEIFAHLNEELLLHDPRRGLLHQGESAHRMSPAAVGRIVVDATGRRLSIQAFHTFPDERAIVRTQSLFELTDPAGPVWA